MCYIMAVDQLHWCKNALGQCYYAIFQYFMSHKHYGHFIYYVMASAAVTDHHTMCYIMARTNCISVKIALDDVINLLCHILTFHVPQTLWLIYLLCNGLGRGHGPVICVILWPRTNRIG
jgi:hypothetical protein